MTDPKPPKRIFPEAKTDARAATHVPSSPQTESAAYRLAFQDTEFLLREDLRPVRFQLELLKPELLLDEADIASTFIFYGSARIPEPEQTLRTASPVVSWKVWRGARSAPMSHGKAPTLL